MNKPYILNYSFTMESEDNQFIYNHSKQLNCTEDNIPVVSIRRPLQTTEKTAVLEPADQDEFMLETTQGTFSTEPTDDDSFCLGETTMTKTLEPADQDSFSFGETIMTRKLEPVDPDEFYL